MAQQMLTVMAAAAAASGDSPGPAQQHVTPRIKVKGRRRVKSRTSYSLSLKLKAVEEAERSGLRAAAISLKLDERVLRQWLTKADELRQAGLTNAGSTRRLRSRSASAAGKVAAATSSPDDEQVPEPSPPPPPAGCVTRSATLLALTPPSAGLLVNGVHNQLSVSSPSADGSPCSSSHSTSCSSSLVVSRADASVGTCSASTMTEPEFLGLCEPGTAVTLDGIVWHETDGGMLVVNVTWRNKTYVGTLMDSTKNDWAPPRFCDSPTSDSESKGQRSRPKRGRTASNTPVTISGIGGIGEFSLSPLNSKLRNGAKGRRSGLVTPSSPAKEITLSGGKRKVSNNIDTGSCGIKNMDDEAAGSANKRSRSSSREARSSSPSMDPSTSASPVLLDCKEPNCSKKYRNINGLRYHQSHAHGITSPHETTGQTGKCDSNSSWDLPRNGKELLSSTSYPEEAIEVAPFTGKVPMPPPSETSVPVNSGGSDPVASPPKLFNLSSLQPLARHSSCPSLKTNAVEQKKSPKGPAVITSSSSSVTKDSLPTGKSNREDVTSPAYSDISDPNDQSTPLLDADFDQKMEGKTINPVAGPSDPEIPSEPLSMYSFYQLPPYLASKSEDSVSKPEEKKESLGPARLEKTPVTPVLRNDSPSLPTPVESKDAANVELKTVAVTDHHPSSTSMVVPACPSGSSSPSSEEKEFSNVFQQIERQFEEEQRTIGHYSGGGGDFDHRTVPESASMFPPRINPHHFQSPSPGSQFGSGWMFNGTSSPLEQMLQQQQQQFQQQMLQQQQMMVDQSTAQQWMQENCQKLQRLQQYHEQPRQPQQPQQPQHKSLALSKTSMPSSASNHRPRPSAVDLEREQRNKNQQGPPTGSSSGAGMSPYGISPNFHPYGLQFDPGFVNTFSSMMGGSPDPFGPVAGSSHYGVPRHPQPGFDELEMRQRQRLAQYYAATSPPAQIGASSATSMSVEGSSQQQQQSHQYNFHHQNSVPTSSAVPSNPSATRANSQGCKLSKKGR